MSANITLPRLHKRFAVFVDECDVLIRTSGLNEIRLCKSLARGLRPLLIDTTWIPPGLIAPAISPYRRECLYEAPDGIFSIGIFSWSAGHRSRIHDHYGWSVLGNMSGVLRSEQFHAVGPGLVRKSSSDRILYPGAGMVSSPTMGDIHRISVDSHDRSISIHIYGSRFDAVNREYYVEDDADQASS
jgi:predicted metal-dependent enzyme (double-stranded beta helix superfamily)